jgi:hypothetical protein
MMKKIAMILLATAMVVWVACGGKKSEAAESVDKYVSLVEQAIPLAETLKSGDISVLDSYTKIVQELSDLASSADFQKDLAHLTPEQTKKYLDAAQKLKAALFEEAFPAE